MKQQLPFRLLFSRSITNTNMHNLEVKLAKPRERSFSDH